MAKKRGLVLWKCKKGISHEVFLNAFEWVLAGIVILALLSFIQSVINNSLFEKNYLSRDVSLVLNTIYAAPGNVKYNYAENTGKFSFVFKFSPSRIEVSDASQQKSIIEYVSEVASDAGTNILSKKGETKEHQKEQGNAPVFYLFAESKEFPLAYTTIEADFIDVRVPFKDAYRTYKEGLVKLDFVKSKDQITIEKK